MPERETVAAELDALHSSARASFRARDAKAFMSLFAPTLRYKQPDGRVIGRDQLAGDVATQLASLEDADTTYVRELLQVDGDSATELLLQTATVTFRYLTIFKRTVLLTRRGRYTWKRFPEGWKIQEVEVLSERVDK